MAARPEAGVAEADPMRPPDTSMPHRTMRAAPSESARNAALSPSVNPPKLCSEPTGLHCAVPMHLGPSEAASLPISLTLSPCACTTIADPSAAALSKAPLLPSRSVTTTSGTAPASRRAPVALSADTRAAPRGMPRRRSAPASRCRDGPAPATMAVLPATISPTRAAGSGSASAASSRTAASRSLRTLYPNSEAILPYHAIHPLRTGRPAPPRPAPRSTRFKSPAPVINLWRRSAGQGRAGPHPSS